MQVVRGAATTELPGEDGDLGADEEGRTDALGEAVDAEADVAGVTGTDGEPALDTGLGGTEDDAGGR